MVVANIQTLGREYNLVWYDQSIGLKDTATEISQASSPPTVEASIDQSTQDGVKNAATEISKVLSTATTETTNQLSNENVDSPKSTITKVDSEVKVIFVNDYVSAILQVSSTNDFDNVDQIAVDLEGGDLSIGGRISLIQIAVTREGKTSVYVFDLIEGKMDYMSKGALIHRLLSDFSVKKIFHDCTDDTVALLNQYNISVCNAFDTQIGHALLTNAPDKFGLNTILRTYGSRENTLKEAVVHAKEAWESRPLDPMLLDYAVQDVKYLAFAYKNLKTALDEKGLFEDAGLKSQMRVAFNGELQGGKVPGNVLPLSTPLGAANFLTFRGDRCHPCVTDHPVALEPPTAADADGADHRDVEGSESCMDVDTDRQDLDLLVSLLPSPVSERIRQLQKYEHISEITLDIGRLPDVWYLNCKGSDADDYDPRAHSSEEVVGHIVRREDVESTTQHPMLGRFNTANRASVGTTLHRVSRRLNLNYDVTGLTLRVGITSPRAGHMISDILRSGRSCLFVGRPGAGKTTLLRHSARVLARHNRVEIIDTTNEIAGDGDTPHRVIGRARRMMVRKDSSTHQVMIEAVQNHTPDYIIVDEVRDRGEVHAAVDIANRGVQIIATAYGTVMTDLLQNPELCELLGGVQTVILGDNEASRRGIPKVVRERKALPVFEVIIELRGREHFVIYHNVSGAVDDKLQGKRIVVEDRREIGGNIVVRNILV